MNRLEHPIEPLVREVSIYSCLPREIFHHFKMPFANNTALASLHVCCALLFLMDTDNSMRMKKLYNRHFTLTAH